MPASFSTLHATDSLGRGDAFVAWLAPTGEVTRVKRYGSADEEYPTAFTSRGDALYLGFKSVSEAGVGTRVSLARIAATGEISHSTLLAEPARSDIAALATTGSEVCAALQIRTSDPDKGGGTDYELRCYDPTLREFRSTRGGAPGAQAPAQGLACDAQGTCVLVGRADTSFEGEAIEDGVEAYALTIGRDGARRSAKSFRSQAEGDADPYAIATCVTAVEAGRFVLAGDANAALFGAKLGYSDGVITTLE